MAPQVSQFSLSSCLCMPLAKFSYATVHAGNTAPIPWIHVASQNDLFILIDPANIKTTAEASELRWKLKVLQDPNFHEDIDLQLLAQEARKAMEAIQMSSEPRRQPSVVVIVKQPCIAMRYPIEGNYIRRFQVRFQKNEDYYETLKILTKANVPITEAGSLPNRPATAPQDSHVAATSAIALQARAPPASVQTYTLKPIHDLSQTISNHRPSLAPDMSITRSTFGNFVSNNISMPSGFSASQPVQSMPHFDSNGNPTFFQSARTDLPASNDTVTTVPTMPHQSASSFDNFVRRPSTAPVIHTQGLNTEHDLAYDIPQQRGKFISNDADFVGAGNINISGEAVYSMQADEDGQNHKQSGRKIKKKGEKRVATKPRNPTAAKKARTTASRPSNNKHATANEASMLDTSLSQQTELPVIDTQTLVQRTETNVATRSQTRNAQNSVSSLDDTDALAVARNTPAQQPHKNELRQSMKLTVSNTAVLQAKENEAQSTKHSNATTTSVENGSQINITCTAMESSLPRPQTTSLSTSLFPVTSNTSTTTPNSHSTTNADNHHSTLKSLMSDPNFTRPISMPTTEQPQNFHALPNSQRRAILETWIVQTLQDENFVQLCNTLEGMWQRIFLYQ